MRAAIFSLLIGTALWGQTSTETWVNTPRVLRLGDLNRFVDATDAAAYKSGAAQLIRETIGIEPGNLTFVIHVARWSGAEIVKQNWYVYRSGAWSDAQFATAKRIYGSRQVWFLYLQLDAPAGTSSTYVIQTTMKSPTYLAHLQTAAGLFGVSLTPAVGEPQNIWNAELVNIPYVPSDVTITAPGGASATFDDEGLSRIDFSAAAPVTKTSSAGMYALADFYFKPVDITSAGFGNWPHLVGGARVGSQPLKNILVGIGWGPVYGGVVMGGGTYKFSFGVNISASAAVSALKK